MCHPILPRFGKTQFFEFPLTNPFAHEERFQIDITDPELRLVTAFDEWLHLRRACRPAVGELGQEPVEADMFDRDGEGHIQVSCILLVLCKTAVLLHFSTKSIVCRK